MEQNGPRVKAQKTMPKNAASSSVPFCLWSPVHYERCNLSLERGASAKILPTFAVKNPKTVSSQFQVTPEEGPFSQNGWLLYSSVLLMGRD